MSNERRSIINVENDTDLEQWLSKSNDFLLFFDVHLNWTGRCETLVPQLEALYLTIDQSVTRWKVLSLEVPKFAAKFESMVDLSSSCSHSLPLNDSNNKVHGENDSTAETLNSLMMKKSSCSPLFLAVKGRKVISIVKGANFPALSKVIHEHIPSLSDDDILEDGE